LSFELSLLLFLLLPIAAWSGWRLARRNLNVDKRQQLSGLSSDYFVGLNFLLNEQPDKAVDVFVKMLEVDSETVETHLALGNLFRRRGEGDRAIRIHQNLIARPTLTKEQRIQALLELGRDYMRAGFLDRAENLFLELVDDKNHKAQALDILLDIYQQEKDWDRAIMTARKIESSTGKQMGVVTAQYYCELAESTIQKGENKAALKTLKRAFRYDNNCVRASLLLGGIEKELKNYKAAIAAYKQIENQDPTYISEAIHSLIACYQALGIPNEGEEYVDYVLKEYGGASSLLALTELTRMKHGDDAAVERIVEHLREKPSILGMHRLIELILHRAETADVSADLKTLKRISAQLLEDSPKYQCKNCGFGGKAMHWQCPTCKSWSTVKPIQISHLDLH